MKRQTIVTTVSTAPERPLTVAEWQAFAQNLHARAKRTSDLIREEARRTCKAAGLDPGLLGIHPHNAMCSYEAGKPWPDVDYRLVRRTLWLIDRQFLPNAIADRIIDRAYRRVIWPN